MVPAKAPRDRRQNKEQRLRYAIRKANDRMFAILASPPADAARAKAQERARH
jgi:hypothetical protein